ncbi:MAG: ABC transporter substrate-binding protein, partial [Chromatiales bacterium]|nr:ABC transporter substrate-binding protein [Chromatiales bacterium]
MKKTFSLLAGSVLAMTLAMGAQAAALKMAYDADPVSLDPHEQLSGGTLQMSHMVFDPLVRWTQDLGFEPRLAESWERIDERTVRFKLRKGVTFHSGNPLTTKDVLWTFNRLKNSPDFKGIFEPFDAVNVIDDFTFDLTTKGAFPLVLHTATYIFPMDSQFYTGTDEKGKDKGRLVKHAGTY